jgi:hypothetical protein
MHTLTYNTKFLHLYLKTATTITNIRVFVVIFGLNLQAVTDKY